MLQGYYNYVKSTIRNLNNLGIQLTNWREKTYSGKSILFLKVFGKTDFQISINLKNRLVFFNYSKKKKQIFILQGRLHTLHCKQHYTHTHKHTHTHTHTLFIPVPVCTSHVCMCNYTWQDFYSSTHTGWWFYRAGPSVQSAQSAKSSSVLWVWLVEKSFGKMWASVNVSAYCCMLWCVCHLTYAHMLWCICVSHVVCM